MGDNGKSNDNMLMHILSPCPQHRSAVTDCAKLRDSQFPGRRVVLIIAFSHPDWPLEPAIDAFERVAGKYDIGERHVVPFGGLRHPVHQAGAIYAWELDRRW